MALVNALTAKADMKRLNKGDIFVVSRGPDAHPVQPWKHEAFVAYSSPNPDT